ncbi:DUF2298 domain-containing protein [bacterium]|nr:DUF2298 domain-containing protein [bacterium]MDY3021511.1 DUF2298 domain-containing protein [Oliverpabstia sp.]
MKRKIVTGSKVLLLIILLVGSHYLLGEDTAVFLKWWASLLVLGIGFLPLTGRLFPSFKDGGWLVSKVLGIAGSGFIIWLLVCCRLAAFTAPVCVSITTAVILLIWLFLSGRKHIRENDASRPFFAGDFGTVLDDELIFTFSFLIWTYFAGFHPAAYGTEKFMDYGFMAAMMRSETLPAKDLWYAGGVLNYYYGGQYFAVFLTKLTGTQVAQTYNLMRTMVAGFAYALPFVLVRQMILDIRDREHKFREGLAVLGGHLAGAGVSLAGNMHYVVVGKLLPWIRKIFHLPEGDYTYWFPNSTRYIGYYPAESDKTIHEFPSYSFVLGDLHAHVVNVMFVLTVICLIYAMVQKYKKNHYLYYGMISEHLTGENKKFYQNIVKEALLEPYVWIFSFFIGLFHWTNYWDFVIYFVMGGLGIIYCNYLKFCQLPDRKWRMKVTGAVSILHAIWVWIWGSLFALPFTLQFETMVNGVALAQNHSRPYQWWLIWGLPFLVTVFYMIFVVRDRKKDEILPEASDFFGIILGFSAIGLILIPELVYVRDIYEKEYARSNTMFKLTYQAFIMFGILMGYAFVRLWMEKKHGIRKTIITFGFVCFIGCCFYITTAVHAWFGQVWDRNQYQGPDATAFLEKNFAEDASAIRWLNENVEGTPVVLEANGDSYSDYERVSAMTGLPTILGWYVHEWLWRGGTEELNQRIGIVEAVYTSSDQELVKSILEEYQVEYIFVGRMEQEKYENLNENMLKSLGNVVFQDNNSGTYILQVGFGASVE